MINPNQSVMKIIDLSQVCFVVHDLEKSMAFLWNTFGIGPWDIYIRDFKSKIDGESIRDMTYYGKPTQFSYKMASTSKKVGGIFIELIQPVTGNNIYRDFLKENGEGVHHLGWHIVDSLEAFGETWKTMEQQGFPCIMSGRVYNTAFAYFNTKKILNTILEVVWRDPTKTRPAPLMVFPEQ
jgi:hypothetical protein